MMVRKKRFLLTLMCAFCVVLCGCDVQTLDPAQIGRFRPVPKVNVILDSLGVAEETPVAWENAEEPRPSDVITYETDYVFGTGDVVRITIFELLQERGVYASDFIVTETGRISIPEVGVVQAAGLTESQLEEEIRRILMPTILKEPSVTVVLVNSQRRTFSILGDGVPFPSRYVIPRYDFRLADALSTAGGISQFNISYIYVSRRITGEEPAVEGLDTKEPVTIEPTELVLPKDEMMEVIAPRAQSKPDDRLVVTTVEMDNSQELTGGTQSVAEFGTETRLEQGFSQDSVSLSGETVDNPIEEGGPIEWIFQDGRWIPVQFGQEKPFRQERQEEIRISSKPLERQLPESFDFDEITEVSDQVRLIEIPADKLLAGDPRYNIVIKPEDTIHVPIDMIGEFYIMGNTNFQGAIRITGRPMTLKMAIASAGGLGPLAWPKKCEVIRRISRNKEEIVMVDLDKIAKGQQPDFFIKPNDLINVGTHPTSRWRAVLRNAFRATYGFGFVYDRNFADRSFSVHEPLGPFGNEEWDPFDW
ncbi:MAG: polysaccharide biosynthesis/export family protein [Planctomycetota bacterium]|jgi:polysaccharide export outer membrane protein